MHIYLCDLRARNSLCISCSLIIGFFFLCVWTLGEWVSLELKENLNVRRSIRQSQRIKITVTGELWKKIFALEVGNAFLKWVLGFFVGWFRRFFYCVKCGCVHWGKIWLDIVVVWTNDLFLKMISGKEWWASETFTWVWDIFFRWLGWGCEEFIWGVNLVGFNLWWWVIFLVHLVFL